jgi:hypothetical protein
VSRLIAQAACQPSILRCFTEVLDPSPATPQLRALPPAEFPEGATFGAARCACADVVCGFLRGSGVVLSPPDGERLRPGDQLVVLRPSPGAARGGGGKEGGVAAAGETVAEFRAAAAAAARARLEAAGRAAAAGRGGGAGAWGRLPPRRRILVVGWPSEELQTLLEGLATFSCGSGGAEITVVSSDPPPPGHPALAAGGVALLKPPEQQVHHASLVRARPARRGWFGWLRRGGGGGGAPAESTVRYLQAAEPLSDAALVAAGIADCDAVVLGAAPGAAAAPPGAAAATLDAAASGGEPGGGEASVLARDARLLHALLALQCALLSSGRAAPPPHVVSQIGAFSSLDLATNFFGRLQQQVEAADAEAAAAEAAGGGGASPQEPAALRAGGGKAKAPAAAAPPAPRAPRPLLGPATMDFLRPQAVVSALLVQMSLDASYSGVMRELLYTAEGTELYLKPPANYGVAPGVCGGRGGFGRRMPRRPAYSEANPAPPPHHTQATPSHLPSCASACASPARQRSASCAPAAGPSSSRRRWTRSSHCVRATQCW